MLVVVDIYTLYIYIFDIHDLLGLISVVPEFQLSNHDGDDVSRSKFGSTSSSHYEPASKKSLSSPSDIRTWKN